MEHDPRWPRLRPFVRGGFWRNFKVKYPEADEMYCRMMMVSRRLQQARAERRRRRATCTGRGGELYRGQCNCGYWHGAFGGIYLPHLRNAVYHHLIAADNLLDRAAGRHGPWIEAKAEDFNFDARQEVRLANDKLMALLAPAAAGRCTNWTCARSATTCWPRSPAGPRPITARCWPGPTGNGDGCASIHDRVVFKQAGLDKRLQYDSYPRKSLIDQFYDNDATLEAVAGGQAVERGDFVDGVYEARIRRNPRPHPGAADPRRATPGACPLRITKGVTLEAGSDRAGDRLPAGGPAAGPAAALRRRVQLRRPARRRRRPLLLSTATGRSGWASSARSST